MITILIIDALAQATILLGDRLTQWCAADYGWKKHVLCD